MTGAVHLRQVVCFFKEFQYVHCHFIGKYYQLYLRLKLLQFACNVKTYRCLKENITLYSFKLIGRDKLLNWYYTVWVHS